MSIDVETLDEQGQRRAAWLSLWEGPFDAALLRCILDDHDAADFNSEELLNLRPASF